jgi:hypothetical protein
MSTPRSSRRSSQPRRPSRWDAPGKGITSTRTWHPARRSARPSGSLIERYKLDEQAADSRHILDDPRGYGLTDPEPLRLQIRTDDAAALVIRSVLDNNTQQDPQ